MASGKSTPFGAWSMAAGVVVGVLAAPPLRAQEFVPITDEVLNHPSDDDWPQYRRTHDAWAHSPLTQIDKENVGFLQLAWSRAIGTGSMEMTPLVYRGVMYLVHPNDRIEAVDATTGSLIWEYERELAENAGRPGAVRNLALYDDKVYYASRDGYLVALRATSGEVVWETFMASAEFATNYTSGPIAANDVIVTGRSCGLFGGVNNTPGGCFILGHDARTGELLWRVNTIARPGEPGGDTWGGLPLEERYHVSPWGVSSFDPELNLIYMGTGVPGPYPSVVHGREAGDALYSNSTLAIDADTGRLVWYYQHLPGDDWDLDHIGERILVDTRVAPSDQVEWPNPAVDPSETRRVLWTAGKGGIQFVLDRTNGQYLWGSPILHQNAVVGISPDGRVTANAALRHREVGHTVMVGQRAAKGWWPGTYSPRTGAVYQPLHNSWTEQTALAWDGIGLGARRVSVRAPEFPESLGIVKGVSVSTGDVLWERRWPTLHSGGLVSTGGGLVFGGDWDRRFRAYDDATGEVLWETILNSRISGGAISFAVDGVQYVAVTTGGGTLYDSMFDLSGLGYESPIGSSTVFVFALPPSLRE
jgi:alcohol dehydrogenase (cytochrome c)